MPSKPKTRAKTAGSSDPVGRPRVWSKAVHVAEMRLLGSTQAEAAKAAGSSVRTVRDWERCSWWVEAIAEANQTYVVDRAMALARKGLFNLLSQGHPQAIMWMLERGDTDSFGPPKLKVEAEHSGPDGGPIRLENETLAKMSASELGESYKDLIGK